MSILYAVLLILIAGLLGAGISFLMVNIYNKIEKYLLEKKASKVKAEDLLFGKVEAFEKERLSRINARETAMTEAKKNEITTLEVTNGTK